MKKLKILGWIAAGLLALIICIALAALAYREVVQGRNEDLANIHSANGIYEAKFVRIGGIDQWVTIRGDNRANPVLIALHGGPGVPLAPVAYNVLKPLEKDFTVVQWDQRGAGKTFGRNPDMPQSALTLQQLESDAVELIQIVRKQLGKEKVGLVAASAGSGFGLSVAKHHPELLFAYVGVGQLTSIPGGDKMLYDFVMSRARATGNKEALSELEAIGAPPFKDIKDSTVARRWLTEFSPPSEKQFNNTQRLLTTIATAPGYSLGDVRDVISGSEFSIKALYDDYGRFDAMRLGRDFQVPLVFIQGDQDYLTPTPLVEQYAGWVHAPVKQVVILRDGGHSASIALPDQFIAALVRDVRPLADRPATPKQR